MIARLQAVMVLIALCGPWDSFLDRTPAQTSGANPAKAFPESKDFKWPGGDIVRCQYRLTLDTGVKVTRFDSTGTEQRWQVICQPHKWVKDKYDLDDHKPVIDVCENQGRLEIAFGFVGYGGVYDHFNPATGKWISRHVSPVRGYEKKAIVLPDGDVIVYRYNQRWNSEIELRRVDPAKRMVIWTANASARA
jgi:hypothetical protein